MHRVQGRCCAGITVSSMAVCWPRFWMKLWPGRYVSGGHFRVLSAHMKPLAGLLLAAQPDWDDGVAKNHL